MVLKSHVGAIGRQFYPWMRTQKPMKGFWNDFYETRGCSTADCVYVSYERNNYLALHDKDAVTGYYTRLPFIFDVEKWNMVPGANVNFSKSNISELKLLEGDFQSEGGGSDWFINNDGTISSKHAPELVLGFKSNQQQG